MVEEIARLVEDGIEDAELEEARAYLLGREPFRRETARQWADLLTEAEHYGLPLDDPEHRQPELDALDRDTVEAAARRHIRPEELRVTVGLPEEDEEGEEEPDRPVSLPDDPYLDSGIELAPTFVCGQHGERETLAEGDTGAVAEGHPQAPGLDAEPSRLIGRCFIKGKDLDLDACQSRGDDIFGHSVLCELGDHLGQVDGAQESSRNGVRNHFSARLAVQQGEQRRGVEDHSTHAATPGGVLR